MPAPRSGRRGAVAGVCGSPARSRR